MNQTGGKTIPSYSNYLITDLGAVWSKISQKWLKPSLQNNGYFAVRLTKNKQSYLKSIHRLLLETFVGPCPENMECRHLNGNRQDNRLENLCWGTRRENVLDAIKHKTFAKWNEKLTFTIAQQIRKEYIPRKFSTRKLAKKYIVSQSTIMKIIQNKQYKEKRNVEC